MAEKIFDVSEKHTSENDAFLPIKGLDNPTSQLLPKMSKKCCSGTGKEGKTKEVVKQVVCEELCVTKLYVKDGV